MSETRDKITGRFIPGVSASPATQFVKGQHWRKPQKHWDKDWLYNQYVTLKKSSSEIAKMCDCTDINIFFWMKKHGIPRRGISEVRNIKHWGQVGSDNPMYGKRGDKNHNWKGGVSPERQDFYNTEEWKTVVPLVYKKCNYSCVRCANTNTYKNPLHIHHIVSFEVKELRSNLINLILLCKTCHWWVHSKNNWQRDFILTHEDFLIRAERRLYKEIGMFL